MMMMMIINYNNKNDDHNHNDDQNIHIHAHYTYAYALEIVGSHACLVYFSNCFVDRTLLDAYLIFTQSSESSIPNMYTRSSHKYTKVCEFAVERNTNMTNEVRLRSIRRHMYCRSSFGLWVVPIIACLLPVTINHGMQPLKITEAMEVFIPHIGKTIVVSSKALSKDEQGTFVKIEPSRNSQIATSIVSRCSKERRDQVAKNKAFWTAKSNKGRQCIDKLRKMRAAAIRAKFDVIGCRFMARGKRQRSQQMTLDSISVPLPTVGERMGVAALMKLDLAAQRKNGRYALWVQLDSEVIDPSCRTPRVRSPTRLPYISSRSVGVRSYTEGGCNLFQG